MNGRVIGIDLGSVSVKFALLQDGRIVREGYARHRGAPLETLEALLRDVEGWESVPAAFTGSGALRLAEALGVSPVNEVVALAAAVREFLPDVGSVVEMGGQDSKLLQFRCDGTGGPVFDDFATNSICAAGTGSFLDQQAARLGLSPEEMGVMAEACPSPPRIAGRCSVFAKSDMIHLQQIGATVEEIAAGLCFAVARNFRSTIAAGREFRGPVAFVGGVAANPAMVKAFREVAEGRRFFVPGHFKVLVAAGAALSADKTALLSSEILRREAAGAGVSVKDTLQPLLPFALPPARHDRRPWRGGGVYLGIDVGSISTNLVAVDEDGEVVAREYLRTAGRPLEAVRDGLRRVRDTLGGEPEVLGVATTGSGRYMTGDFVGADTVRNEISAQARAALHIDPSVDTIFEIGGQDSKYIFLREGRVADFEMNKVCAAGTGSFLEEQAEKLGIPINDFGPMALESPGPARLGERCTVFMESDVVSRQSDGVPLRDIAAGLCVSVVRNYLHRVVGRKAVGNRIFFQGGTAFNQGVVAAFNMVLGDRRVTVPDHHDVTGAIGAALLVRDMKPEKSSFRGFALAEETWSQDSFICRSCSNNCEIHRVTLQDGRKLFYGGRCEKYETGSLQTRPGGENLFPLREKLLREFAGESEPESDGPVIGIPEALWFWELYPFFGTFFRELGCRVTTSGPSGPEVVHRGVESTAAETCFPVKIAHGHTARLLEKGVDFLFLPSILRSAPPVGDFTESYNCPFVEASPYMLDAGLSLKERKSPVILRPVLDFSLPGEQWMEPLVETALRLGFGRDAAVRAARKAVSARNRFAEALRSQGDKALENIRGRRAFVVVSRPYNGNDPMVNTDLPNKLARLGALVIPMDFLRLPMEKVWKKHRNMYWTYGQRIIAAAEMVKSDPRLNAVYISNFGCGPDSFIEHIFSETMGDKPYLVIEIDEHAADTGVITRCEAFLDSLEAPGKPAPEARDEAEPQADLTGRTLWIPYLSDASHLAAAVARNAGLDARVIPPTTSASVALGRGVTSGRECYPAIITSGGMMEILASNPPEKTAFFMGTASGPCRFGQYCEYHRMILRRLGHGSVPIITSSSSDGYATVEGLSTFRRQKTLFQGVALVDNLCRALYRVRPYETNPGETDRVYREQIDSICAVAERGGSLGRAARRAARAFAGIPRRNVPRRPRVAVFGEIYIRNDPYANDNTNLRIEELGAEVVYSPVTEWLDFVNLSYVEKSRKLGRKGKVLAGMMKSGVMAIMRHPVDAPFRELLSDTPHAGAAAILKFARPYMPENIGGEAILCIGAPLALMSRGGIQGAVNVLPFGCLPGTVVSAVSRRLRRDRPDLPWLNLAFDGQEDCDNSSRLEAFIFQVKKYAEKKGDSDATDS